METAVECFIRRPVAKQVITVLILHDAREIETIRIPHLKAAGLLRYQLASLASSPKQVGSASPDVARSIHSPARQAWLVGRGETGVLQSLCIDGVNNNRGSNCFFGDSLEHPRKPRGRRNVCIQGLIFILNFLALYWEAV